MSRSTRHTTQWAIRPIGAVGTNVPTSLKMRPGGIGWKHLFNGWAEIGSISLSLGAGYSITGIVFAAIDIDQSWCKGEIIDLSGPIARTNVQAGIYPLGAA